jgi:hypothetical protein
MTGRPHFRLALALGLAALAALSACASAPPKPPQSSSGRLSKRASFDLACPVRDLHGEDIDDKTVGVRGCGRRAVYIYACHNERPPGYGLLAEKRECQWLRQGEVQSDDPAPQPKE